MAIFLNMEVGTSEIIYAIASSTLVYILTLWIYRLTLHPYAKYPGPLLGKLTSFYGAWYAKKGSMHLDIERCHLQYGPIVRYTPNGLLFNTVDGFHDIYDAQKNFIKSPSYIVHKPGNVLGIQNRKEHARMKKIISGGFSDAALREHEPKVLGYIDQFCQKISEDGDAPVKLGTWTKVKNMSQWCNYLTLDIITDVVFSTPHDLLNSAKDRIIIDVLEKITKLVGILHQSAIMRFATPLFLPRAIQQSRNVRKVAANVVKASLKEREKDPTIRDVFAMMIAAKNPETGGDFFSPDDLRINSSNLLIAGSDTSSTSLASAFFYLSRNATAYDLVANEIRSTFPNLDAIRSGPLLNSCTYLRAALTESLRLTAVAPTPLWRTPESGNGVVDGVTIPSGYLVGSCLHSMHHKASVFPNPYAYNIKRWILTPDASEQEKEELKERLRCWAPFSVGPRMCLAKNFAMMEMLLTLARVFWQMDFKRAEGEGSTWGEGSRGLGQGREREGELQISGGFTSSVHGPGVQFKKREVAY